MEEIFATISIVIIAKIFIVLSFSIYLTIRIFTGKSIHNKEYSPVHATVFDLLLHSDEPTNYTITRQNWLGRSQPGTMLYDYQTEIARKKPTYRFLSPGQSDIFTADPRNVEHILKTRFDNYSKGESSRENLAELLGHGIFSVDGDKWKQQRKLASFEFSTRVLRDFSCSVFRTNASKLVGFVTEFALSGNVQAVREDILSRFLVESEKDPENMNDKYLRDIILNFMIAGKDTTAASLSQGRT